MTEGNIESGKRVPVIAGDFEGDAGLQGDVLAYIPNRHGAPAASAGTIKVDGVDRTIVAVERSSYVQRMLLVRLAAAEARNP